MRQLFVIRPLSKLGSAKEWVDEPWVILEKVKYLASLISKAKYPIVFTGAGISTSAGIPDYRSGPETVVSTGAGLWNRGSKNSRPANIDQIIEESSPSVSHMAIKTLIGREMFKFLVSQNTDGLHLRSGVNFNQIAELHGNRNVESCLQCSRKYLRDFRTFKPNSNIPGRSINHQTDRHC
jgi:NAD-dependent SIR2 family protein deacetylase